MGSGAACAITLSLFHVALSAYRIHLAARDEDILEVLSKILMVAGLLVISPAGPLKAAPTLAPGTISVEAGAPDLASGAPVSAFVDAVGEALTVRGFTILEGRGHARLVAELLVTQVEVGTGHAKVAPADKTTVAAGGAQGVGGNVFVPLPSGKLKIVAILQTRLQVRIRKLGDDAVLWDGAALTVRPDNAGSGRAAVVATDLARALFRGFPSQPEGMISVP